MKNLKYVYKFLLVLPLVFMAGCIGSDDYEDVLSNQSAQQSTVFIETDDASEITRDVLGYVPVPIEVGVNNVQSGDITVSFNVTKNGAAAVAGVDYTLDDATIFASDVTGSSDITFFRSGTYIVTVGNSSDGSLVVVDNKAIFKVPPAVTVSISWGDSWYDYDIFLFDGFEDGYSDFYSNGPPAGSNIIGFSNGISAFESFVAYPPEGNSYLYIEDYYNDNAGLDVVLIVEVDGVEEVYDVVMDMDKWVLLIETTIDAEGNISYDFTAL